MNAIYRHLYWATAPLVIGLLLVQLSRSADYSWTGNGNIWSAAGNWTPGGGPPNMAGDTATLGAAQPNTVVLDVDVSIKKVTLNSAAKTLQVTNRNLAASEGFDIQAGSISLSSSTLTTTKVGERVKMGPANSKLIVTGNSTITTADPASIESGGTVSISGTATDGAQLTLSGDLYSKTFEMTSNAAGKQTILTLAAGNGFLVSYATVRFLGTAGSNKVQGTMLNLGPTMEVKRNTTFEGKPDTEHRNIGTISIDKNTVLTLTGKTLQNGFGVRTGTIQGNGTLDARQLTQVDPKGVINSGYLKPGDSPGILTIDGDLTQVDPGSLDIELAGTAIDPLNGITDYDRLVVTGQSVLGGELHVSLIDAFLGQLPSPGDTFDVLTSDGGLSGFFTNASSYVYTTDGLGRFDVTYIPGSGSPSNPGIVRLSNFFAIPEPGTYFLMISSIGVLMILPARKTPRRKWLKIRPIIRS
jgi:hypothetical protein